jgi:hypothetical protein
MSCALDAHFVRDHLSWHPYLYWKVLADLRVPTPTIEERLAPTGSHRSGWAMTRSAAVATRSV